MHRRTRQARQRPNLQHHTRTCHRSYYCCRPPLRLPYRPFSLFFLAGLRIRFGLRAGVGTGRLSGELLLAARLSPDGRRRDMVAVRGVFLVYNKPYCGYSATSTLS